MFLIYVTDLLTTNVKTGFHIFTKKTQTIGKRKKLFYQLIHFINS